MKFTLFFLSAVVVMTYSAGTSHISTSGELDKLFFDSLFTSSTDSGINFEMTADNNIMHPVKQVSRENDTFGAQAQETTVKGEFSLYPNVITNPQLATFGSVYAFEFGLNSNIKIIYQPNYSMQLALIGSSFDKGCDVFESIFKVEDFVDSIKSLPDIINGKTTLYFSGEMNCERRFRNGEYPWYKKITENPKFLKEFSRPENASTTVWIRNQESSSAVESKQENNHGKSYISTSGYYDQKFFDDILDADKVDLTHFDGINFAYTNTHDEPRTVEAGWHVRKNTNTEGITEEVFSYDINITAPLRMITKGFIATNERANFSLESVTFIGAEVLDNFHLALMGIGGESIENSAMCDWITGDNFKKSDFVDSVIANFDRGAILKFIGIDFPGCTQWQSPIIQDKRFNKHFTPAEVWKKKEVGRLYKL